MKTIYAVRYDGIEGYKGSDIHGIILAFYNEEEARKMASELNTAGSMQDIIKVISEYVENDTQFAKDICDRMFECYYDNIEYSVEDFILGADMCKVPD